MGGTDAGNYNVAITNADLNINKAALTVTAATNTTTYDRTTGAAAAPTVTSGALQGTDSFGTLSEAYLDKTAGTGKTLTPTATISDGNGGNNYTVTLVNNTTGVINRADATVTGTATTVTYNGASQTQNAAATGGFFGGDDISVSGLASGRNAGTYTSALAVGGTDAGNYNVAITNADLTINKAQLAVTAKNYAKLYSGTPYQGGNGVVFSGFVAGESASVLGGALAYGGSSQGAVDAGNYTIAPSGLTSGNYNIIFNNGRLSILQSLDAPVNQKLEPPAPLLDQQADPTAPPPPVFIVASADGTPSAPIPSGGTALPHYSAGSDGAGDTPGNHPADHEKSMATLEPTPILVVIPVDSALSEFSFSFPLPVPIQREVAAKAILEKVSMPGGGALPVWLRYDRDSKMFVGRNVPKGALPITVAVSVGGQRWLVTIRQQ